MPAFEDFVNTELPLRANISGLPTADRYARFTGVGRTLEERTIAQLITDLGLTFQHPFYHEDPTVRSYYWFSAPVAITITRVKHKTNSGSLTFELYERGLNTWDSSGTRIIHASTDTTANSTLSTISSFNNAGIAADNVVSVVVAGVTSPADFILELLYTID